MRDSVLLEWTKAMNLIGLVAILTGTLAASPVPGAWHLHPKYAVGQELTYEGKTREVRSGANVQSESEMRLFVRALVLEKSSGGVAAIGCCTVHKVADPKVAKPNQLEDAVAMRFEEVNVQPSGCAVVPGPLSFTLDARGGDQPEQSARDSAVLPESMSVRELGFFVEFPNKALKAGEKWTVRPIGQPAVTCQIIGPETVIDTKCVSVAMHQESQNWNNESLSTPAWRMDAKVWVDDKTKTVFKVERTSQIRQPGSAGEHVTRTVSYEQATNIRYHGDLLQRQIDDYRTVQRAFSQLESVALVSQKADREKQLKKVRQELKLAMQRLYSTTYRPAVERLDDLAVQMAKAEEGDEEPAIILASRREATVGEKAPHFVVRNAKTGETVSRKTTRGKPVVLVYIDPASELSMQALETAVAAVRSQPAADLVLLAVCTSIDDATEAALKEKVPGDYTVCTGGGSDAAYGIDGTPHVVVIDPDGILRVNQMGFGPGMHKAVAESVSSMKVENIANDKDKKKSFLR